MTQTRQEQEAWVKHMLEEHAEIIGKNVTYNLLNRHILPIFGNA